MITHVAACRIDIAIIVDCSTSIRAANPPGVDNWQYIKDFMVDLVTSINVGVDETHVGAVSFGRQLERYRHFMQSTTPHIGLSKRALESSCMSKNTTTPARNIEHWCDCFMCWRNCANETDICLIAFHSIMQQLQRAACNTNNNNELMIIALLVVPLVPLPLSLFGAFSRSSLAPSAILAISALSLRSFCVFLSFG